MKAEDPFSLLNERKFETLALLLEEAPDVATIEHPDGWRLLHAAAEVAPIEIIHRLISLGADVNESDRHEETPIFWAIEGSNLPVVEFLISNGAQLNIPNKRGDYPIHVAAMEGDVAVIEVLLSNNVSINQGSQKYGVIPLHFAVAALDKELVDYLIGRGADINLQDKQGETALHSAIMVNSIFLDAKLDIVELLLSHGADPNIKNVKGVTSWDNANLFFHDKFTQLLEKYRGEK